ncbi:UPF0755 protein [Desulfonispora thiosulfatigenes DSM 11270]|uniref:Endolytic murein transglycosylase n=1 Tax=Desulfonispora thiosulfatigenes DSM 11270 TaxID=656914 RepID=A0A1W1VQH0_DESTI|nr:endolytic transglycosylase MltG [Desulfonispora thiosulfatigenes]SMB95598.1 UPF0755 protein [Desulfonispora thiosulfatigenes DSM 11270]
MVKIGTKDIYKNKKSLALYLLIILFIIWLIFNGLFGANNINNKDIKLISIKSGSSTISIAKTLEKEGIITNALAFRAYLTFNGIESSLKAGDYKLSPSMTMKEISKALINGQTYTISFTIPEGYTLNEICNVLVEKDLVDKEEFWQVVENEPFTEFAFLQNAPQGQKRLEGFLFPDTYEVGKSMSAKQIITVMLKRFENVYNSLPEMQSGLSPWDLIILASVVEKEAILDEERPIIASVFINRLNTNMKLQSCATLQYLFPERKDKIYIEDEKIDSPYNTYKNYGLPKGPICSPGEASLIAASKPEVTNYFYFVAKKDGSGGHLFSTTHDEHVKNKRKLGY